MLGQQAKKKETGVGVTAIAVSNLMNKLTGKRDVLLLVFIHVSKLKTKPL
jgi:hypothetical protein